MAGVIAGTRGAAAPLPHRAYAGLVSRSTGLLVDAAVVTAAVIAVDRVPVLAWESVLGRVPNWLTVTTTVLARALPWLYFAACWWLGGQTLGAMLVGVAVRRPDGRHLGPARAATRAAACLLLAPLWAVGLLAVLWDPQRRALHDMLFSTVVRHVGRHTPHH